MNASCRALPPLAWLLLVALLLPSPVAAQQSGRSLTIGATVGYATSLTLSDSVLRVEPAVGSEPSVVGTIVFEARARTRSNGEVLLTVEALRDIDTLAGGASNGAVVIEYAGDDAGVVSGVLSTSPQIAGRWVGSGIRPGRLTFSIRAAGYLSGGVIPLRFVLSTP